MKKIFTNGVFDVLHVGHIEILKKAKKLGGILIVGINSDTSVKKIKGNKRPINNQNNRKLLLESIKYVDKVIIFNDLKPSKLINQINPDYVVKGGDYTAKFIRLIDKIPKKTIIKIIKFKKGHSSTKIINKIVSL